MKIYVKLIEETPEAKFKLKSSCPNDWVCVYNTKALNFFDPELHLPNTKLIIKNELKDLLA